MVLLQGYDIVSSQDLIRIIAAPSRYRLQMMMLSVQKTGQAQLFPDEPVLTKEDVLSIHPSSGDSSYDHSSQERIHSLFITYGCFRAMTCIHDCIIIKV